MPIATIFPDFFCAATTFAHSASVSASGFSSSEVYPPIRYQSQEEMMEYLRKLCGSLTSDLLFMSSGEIRKFS
jgi:hypothetical protein